MTEKTLVLIKPDGVQRGLVGDIISRLERKGFHLVGLKMLWMDENMAARHYAEHCEKDFYPSLEEFITSGPLVAMAWQGENVISGVRNLMGSTDPQKAAPGTIRGEMALFVSNNLVHGSDSPESAQRELDLFFQQEEIYEYVQMSAKWLGY